MCKIVFILKHFTKRRKTSCICTVQCTSLISVIVLVWSLGVTTPIVYTIVYPPNVWTLSPWLSLGKTLVSLECFSYWLLSLALLIKHNTFSHFGCAGIITETHQSPLLYMKQTGVAWGESWGMRVNIMEGHQYMIYTIWFSLTLVRHSWTVAMVLAEDMCILLHSVL